MNHCLDCNSMYETPGTCNCFAPGGKRAWRTAVSAGTGTRCPKCFKPYAVPANSVETPCTCDGMRVTYENVEPTTLRYNFTVLPGSWSHRAYFSYTAN